MLGLQPVDFVSQNRDGLVPFSQQPAMPSDNAQQPLLGLGDRARRLDNHRFEPLHGEVHDRVEQVLFAFDVVVQSGLGQIDRRSDAAHRGRVKALLVKDLGGLGIDLDRAIAFRLPSAVSSSLSTGNAQAYIAERS